MTGSPLKSAVIGCGTIAFEHLPYLETSPRVQLVATCDRSQELARFCAARFSAEGHFSDAQEMLERAKPDVVHILTPPSSHAQLVSLALRNGAHVICEKPMTGTAPETKALLDEARQSGRVLQESRNYLFNDSVVELMALIESGRLGSVVECDLMLSLDFLAGPFGDRNLSGPALDIPGGAVHDFLPHLVYLFQAFTGTTQAREVWGRLENLSGNPRSGYEFLDVLIDTPEGKRGRLRVATDAQPDMFRVAVRGTQAAAEADLYNPYLRIEGLPNVGKRAPIGQLSGGWSLMKGGLSNFRNKVGQHGTYHGLPRMLDAIYRSIQAGDPPPFSDDDMVATAALSDQIIAIGKKS